jgi:hypothetical protein
MGFKVSRSDLTRVLLHNGLYAVVSILQDTTEWSVSSNFSRYKFKIYSKSMQNQSEIDSKSATKRVSQTRKLQNTRDHNTIQNNTFKKQ